MYSPLEQFIVIPYIRIVDKYYDFTFSNMSIFIILSSIITYILLNSSDYIISNRKDRIVEILYIRIEETIREMIGKSKYLPLVLIIFTFIFINNIIGLIPYTMTVTSHIIYTLAFSLSIMIGTTIIGINKHGIKFFNLFIPSGLDNMKFIIPFIFFIEVISYLSRIVSLSVRLTANMISGHLLLHVATNFGIHLSIFLFFIPIFLLFPIYILEFAVSIIQSYVFALLLVSYIKDVEHLH